MIYLVATEFVPEATVERGLAGGGKRELVAGVVAMVPLAVI